MTNAISSFGVELQRGDGATPENFVKVSEVLDIKGPGLELDVEEVTSHDSTDGWEEVIPTILKGGEVTFDMNYIPSDQSQNATTGILADMQNRTLRNWKLVFPDASNTTWEFAAYVVGFEPDAPVKGKLGSSVTLRVTGKPTLA